MFCYMKTLLKKTKNNLFHYYMSCNDRINRFINENYNSLKSMMKREWRKLESTSFDEDIFHDTLLKCMDKFEEKEFNENDFKAYLTQSFKINVVRERLYYNNNMRSDTDVEIIEKETFDVSYIDVNTILENVKSKFGNENYEKFLDWLDDKSIKEINEKHYCNNSRYIIDKIKDFIKKKYGSIKI